MSDDSSKPLTPSAESIVRDLQEISATAVTQPMSSAPTVISANREDSIPRYAEGDLIDGRYRVEAIRGGFGKSGMGIVYIVSDGETRHAVKTFQRRFARDLRFIHRFIREARTWMLLGFHRNIVRARGLDIIAAAPYLFMEYIESDAEGRHSVADWLRSGPLPLPAALDCAVQYCSGMHHAASAAPGLVHRDLKPDNLLLTPGGILKITDFGLVRARDAMGESFEENAASTEAQESPEGLTQAGAIFGTPDYMAPEQFEAAEAVTIAADIYAFGCCLYAFLAGTPPFYVRAASVAEQIARLRRKHSEAQPTPISGFVPACPPALDTFILKCLEKKPEARFASFDEMLEELTCIHTAALGAPPRSLEPYEPTPHEVAGQMRSLTLLDGYDQAIRLRNLRDNQDNSPYAFHLALASFFHCQDDPVEERRQLERAASVRVTESGYESVRRLGELLVSEDECVPARVLLDNFLEAEPGGLDRILEPYIRLHIREERYDEALSYLNTFPGSIRVDLLRAEVLHAAGHIRQLEALLEAMLENVLERLRNKLAGVDGDMPPGWAEEGDGALLRSAFQSLGLDGDAAVLEALEQEPGAVWPDLGGYPDFAPDMAVLSHVLGELALLWAESGGAPLAESYEACARMLGYPRRLPNQLERDEYWFWLKEAETAQ